MSTATLDAPAIIRRQPEHDSSLARTLKNLIMRQASDDQIRLAMHMCDRYGFDPFLKHLVFISGNLYVTRDGLLDNAHRSGQFDGIEVVDTELVDGAWVATVRVWRKDMSHPFTYTAHQREHENPQSPVWVKAPRAMTVKCAEVMALRRAFNVSLGAAEEIGVDDGVGPAVAVVDELPTTYGGTRTGADDEPVIDEDPKPLPTAAQVRKLEAMAAALRIKVPNPRSDSEAVDLIESMSQRLQERQAAADRSGYRGSQQSQQLEATGVGRQAGQGNERY